MRNFIIIGFVFASPLFVGEAAAQFNSNIFNQNSSLRSQGGYRTIQSNILARPTTSPYLALTDLTGTGGDFSTRYFTSVRPRLEMQQNTQNQMRQIQSIQRNVSELRSAAARRNQNGPSATGHPTRFGMYLHYYPALGR